ncbi:MAG: hemolysin family protein [Candidatus Omnitrophica bacterium]|nr:hemolysin family protein [Candidatus Omnitrophota bacterium]
MHPAISLPITIVLLLILGLFSFFFSASETSIIGLSKIRLRHMVSRGIRRSQSVQRIMAKLDKFIVAILVGNNLVNIAMSAILTGICVYTFGYKWGIIFATVIGAFFFIIFCEITPKIIAIKHTERIALIVAPFMEVFINVFSPFLAIFNGAGNLLIKLMRIEPAKRSPLVTEEELRMMIEVGKEEGFLSDEEGKMLHKIFEFGDTRVTDVMVLREKMTAVNVEATPEELLNIFAEEGHERLPAYKGSIETVVGVIHARDLLYILRDKGLFLVQDLLREACFVPGNMRVNELLKKFQAEKIQIAIVIDERSKKTIGMVTLQDLIEEIVGEIQEKRTNVVRRQLHRQPDKK